MRRTRRFPTFSVLAAGLLAVATLPAAAQVPDDTGYGFFRTVEGTTRLTTFEKAEPIEVEPNYPVLTGDRIWVTPGSRVEMVLADRTVVRADGSTDLYLETLALSADGDSGAPTVMNLLEGELQIRVERFFDQLEPTLVETGNASIFLQSEGAYRIRGDEAGYSQVVVRDGFAEVRTERGSVVVRAGEEAVIEGVRAPRVGLGAAAELDGLELWGAELDGYATAGVGDGYVDPSLSYAAAPLYEHGDWVDYAGRRAWRPRVHSRWSPYSDGWWVYTPSGLTFVSYDPWGWVTSHYGVWDYLPSYGWVWYPGSIYSPAWVYWYWGPTHVAWVPVGYYSRHYLSGHHYGRFGLAFGVYGWAGGSWDYFTYWTFCPVRYFGRRGYRAYWRSGVELRDYGRERAVPRGVITTDTRSLHPGRWGKPTEVVDALRRAGPRDQIDRLRGDLPDVTDFVARRPQLSDEARSAVFRGREAPNADAVRERIAAGARPGARVGAPEAPWRVERPMPRTDLGGERFGDGGLRDAAVSRGLRVDELRRDRAGRGSTVLDRAGSLRRPMSSERPGFPDDRPDGGRFEVGREELRRALPPSGRSAFPSDDSRFVSPDRGSSDRMPVVRRILEGVRSGSREAPSGGSVTPRYESPRSRPEVRDSGAGSRPSARPGSSSGGSTARPGAPAPQRPSASPRSSSGRDSSARSGSSSSRSRSSSRVRSTRKRGGG